MSPHFSVDKQGEKFVMRVPDNGHAHFRQGDILPPFLIKSFIASGWRGRIVAEPNTMPPLLTGEAAVRYCEQLKTIGRGLEHGEFFEPVPVMQITENTDPQIIYLTLLAGVKVFKVYPFFVTTNSENGVKNYLKIYPALEMVQTIGGIVQFHPEDPDFDVEGLYKEASFFECILEPIRREFPELKISAEHVTTRVGVEWIRSQQKNTVASLTIHHLKNTIDDLIGYSARSGGKMSVHEGCKPQAKFREDRDAIVEAALSGDRRFLYGGDDAPHLRRGAKEVAHAACGVWNTVTALPLLVDLFEYFHKLGVLEPFLSEHWASFYGYRLNEGSITLIRKPWTVPEEYPVPGAKDSIVPFWAGEELRWQIAD